MLPRTSNRTVPLVRVTLNFVPDLYDQVRAYAGRRGISVTEAIRRAVAVQLYLDKRLQDEPGLTNLSPDLLAVQSILRS